ESNGRPHDSRNTRSIASRMERNSRNGSHRSIAIAVPPDVLLAVSTPYDLWPRGFHSPLSSSFWNCCLTAFQATLLDTSSRDSSPRRFLGSSYSSQALL